MNMPAAKKKQNENTVIIGCGRLGGALAVSLSENGGIVTVIDRSKDSFRKLSPSFSGLTIIGSATDLEILAEARIDRNTTVVCVTDNANINIMSAQIVKTLFSAGRAIARLYDPEMEQLCAQSGIESICPATLSARAINSLIGGNDREEAL